MTTDRVAVDDPKVLRHILATVDALLLDFDGPVCAVFANLPAYRVAGQLRDVLIQGGHTTLPTEIENTDDPFDVFTYAATLGTGEARYVEAALQAREVEAVTMAEPTRGAYETITAWRTTTRKLAIVSNNSQAAVNTYLRLHNLDSFVHTVSARTSSNPALLKPSPHLIHEAAMALGVEPTRCALVGDSSTDIRAAHTAHALSIGFANKPGKISTLEQAGAHTVITSMRIIASAMATT